MLKKLCVILIAAVMFTIFSMTAFAGNTEGSGSIDLPAQGITGDPAAGTQNSVVETEEEIARKRFNSEYESTLKNGEALDNGQFIMTITKPENDKDSTYKKSYIISGKSEFDDVVISVARLNRKTGEYELIRNTDGDRSWGIGSGIFSTEILLIDGVNNLLFISYRKSEMVEGKIQFNSVTVELLPESITDKVTRKAAEIGKSIAQGIEKIQSDIDIFGRKGK
jgi:hypothetical protein